MVCAVVVLLFVPPLLPVAFAISWQDAKVRWGVLGMRCGTLLLLLVGGELGLCLVSHFLSLPFSLLLVFPFLFIPGFARDFGIHWRTHWMLRRVPGGYLP